MSQSQETSGRQRELVRIDLGPEDSRDVSVQAIPVEEREHPLHGHWRPFLTLEALEE